MVLTLTFVDHDSTFKIQYLWRRCRHTGGVQWPRTIPKVLHPKYINCSYTILITVSSVCRWRVQLMERAMRQLNFETVDTLLQVPICHCRCVCHQNNLTRSNRSMIMPGSGAVPVQRQAGRQPLKPAVFSLHITPNASYESFLIYYLEIRCWEIFFSPLAP